MTALAATRAWLRERCPAIDKADRFNAGYLGAKPTAYTLTLAGVQYTQDVCGRRTATVHLLFLARLPFGEVLEENLSAAEFFAGLADWLLDAQAAHDYPGGIDGYGVCRLAAQNAGLVLSAEAGSACYQMQITLTMEEKEDA